MSKPAVSRRGVRWGVFCACASLLLSVQAFATTPADYAVQVSATVGTSPAHITLSWPSYSASSYKIYRKSFGATSWGSAVASLSGSATSWTDNNVSVGSAYEYQIVRSASVTGYGFIYAGVNANMIDNRGKCALVVDSSMTGPLASELDRLELDLIGDGWTVQRVVVGRSDSVGSVRNAIKATGARSVFLFGRIPVPYSGDFAPDGHADHTGAWPTDEYYADWDGSWTDTKVNDTQAKSSRGDNVPGDGKFDQSTLPSDTNCEIGRVDLYDMGTFGKSETELLRQYLNKEHAFRHGQWGNARKGVIDDNFGDYAGQGFAANGWRNFAPMFGASNVVNGDFFSGSYLWGYGTGGGNFTSAAGVGSTSSFTSGTSVVFTMLFGSYFGDWDSTNNFLRAPLAAPSGGLSASWSARPYWYYHHMALGEVIGYSARLSQNNSSLYYTINHSVRGVHMALMGDPTLRLHPVKPPSGLTATAGGGVTLRWNASGDSNIVGYHVYRSSSQKGSYSRLTGSPVSGTSYVDGSVSSGTYWYMVRAVKLESGGSGTYYNPSQGVFASSGAGGGGGGGSAPSAPSSLAASGGDRQISLTWSGSSGATSYKVKRSGSSGGPYTQVGSTSGTTYTDTGLTNGTPCYYVVTASNSVGESGSSNQASATPQSTTTGGSLPSPWQQRDIGSVGIAGSGTYSSGTFTLKGSGGDIWGTADAFHFVYQPLAGDGQIVARVASLQNTDPWAKAGVMIRDGLNANSAHAMAVVSIANGTAFQRRLSTGAASDHTGASGAAPYWVKLVRTGSTIAGYVSSNNSTWTKIDSCTISMGSSVEIGLIVTAHDNGALCSASFDNVSVTTGGGNNPPPPPPPPPGTGGAIPGKIQAEDYNQGGEGVGYHDMYAKNEGGAYRTSEGVDTGSTVDVGGGYYVGWTAAGEWLMFDINAAASDSYNFALRTATTKTGMAVHLEIDGKNVGSGTVPNTGGWESWAYTTINNVSITAGSHKLKLVFDTGVISLNYINVTSATMAAARVATIDSVSANPTPAKTMEAVGFNAATSQADYGTGSDPVAIVWDFGDGLYDVGNTPTHTYTVGGDYAVSVTVTDSAGNSQQKAITVPVTGAAGGSLTVKRLMAGVNFRTENHDVLRLDALAEAPADLAVAGAAVSIDCGGAVFQATLDGKGRAKVDGGTIKATRVRGSGELAVSLGIQRTALAAALANEGVRNDNVMKAPITVPVTVTIGGQSFSGTFDGTYSSRSGRTGRVK